MKAHGTIWNTSFGWGAGLLHNSGAYMSESVETDGHRTMKDAIRACSLLAKQLGWEVGDYYESTTRRYYDAGGQRIQACANATEG